MKKFVPSFLALSALLFTDAHAAFQPQIVSADAQWVLHADLETLRNTAMGRELIDLATKAQAQHSSGPVQLDVAKLITTIGSITAYGSKFSKNAEEMDGTLVFEGTADLRKIAEGYIAQATVSSPDKIQQLTDFPIEAYAVGGKDAIVVAFPTEPIVLVSRSKEQILKARDVYAGKAASLKGSKSSIAQLLQAERSPYLRAASVIPSADLFPEGAPQARLLQMTEAAALSLGETDTDTYAHLGLVAASDANADKLLKIVQGLAAMASLAETRDQQLAVFLQSIAVKRADRNVTLDLAYPTARLLEMGKNLRETDKPKPPHAPAAPEGKVIATWVADENLGNATPAAETLTNRSIENVALVQGTTIILQGGRNGGEHGRFDMVEIVPTGGGPSLKFEAEMMVLRGYQKENVPAASGGKLVMAQGPRATARFQFPAATGSYTVNVRYVDENDGASTFSVSLVPPEVEAN